jgi:hypothetical protein
MPTGLRAHPLRGRRRFAAGGRRDVYLLMGTEAPNPKFHRPIYVSIERAVVPLFILLLAANVGARHRILVANLAHAQDVMQLCLYQSFATRASLFMRSGYGRSGSW